jgi:ABC-2 type transport system ATP-binding protein
LTSVISTYTLTKRYPRTRTPALQGLNLDIPAGQLFGLVGPDGAGKTTTLRILATVITASSGEAVILGEDVLRHPQRIRRHIGYMPQNFSLYPDLSVLENLNFFADIQGVPAAARKERLPELLSFSRLVEFQQRRAEHLSGGMRKKLALACAMIHQPDVLLLDEPTTGVDPVSRRELWTILTGIIARGVTVLLTTPYMDEAERCHRLGMLNEGQILMEGTPQELENSLPFEILELIADPRPVVEQVLHNIPNVLTWRMVGNRWRLAVYLENDTQTQIQQALAQAGASIQVLRRVNPGMEDVFIYLAEQKRGTAWTQRSR